MDSPQPTFGRFLMTSESARLILENLSPEKNLTSNGCKPIRVLTCTKSSCSDDHLPIGYSLPDFQPHRSNFFAQRKFILRQFYSQKATDSGHMLPPPPPTQPGRKEVDTWAAPPNPPGGSCQYKQYSMSHLSARSNLVNSCLNKI